MDSNLLLMLPLLVPLYGAILCLLLWHRVKAQAVIAAITQASLLLASGSMLSTVLYQGILTTQVGNWPAPFGITLVSDIFSALMIFSTAVVGMAVFLFSLHGLDSTRKRYGYYPLLLFLQMGVSGVCLTGDLFNLYVWFEVLLICCFALLSLGGKRSQLEGTLKYVTINFVASGLLLTGIGVVYTLYGSLNLAELGRVVRQADHPNLQLLTMSGIFFLTGFGIKSAIFPLFFWLPASYHTPPIAISAFIAGVISKIGIYTLVRLFTLIFVVDQTFMQPLLIVLSGFTMVLGVLGAAAQADFRKILSFHIISQIGYMLMGLAIYTPLAIAGSIFFIVHNVVVKTNLFLISGVVAHRQHTFALKKLGGVYLRQPIIALLFLMSALALAGIPPFSGFWGKYMLARSGFEAGQYGVVVASLCVSLITILSMTKIWNEVFWKKKKPIPAHPPADSAPIRPLPYKLLYVPVIFLMGFILFISLYPQPVIKLVQDASYQLLHTNSYIEAVLKKGIE